MLFKPVTASFSLAMSACSLVPNWSWRAVRLSMRPDMVASCWRLASSSAAVGGGLFASARDLALQLAHRLLLALQLAHCLLQRGEIDRRRGRGWWRHRLELGDAGRLPAPPGFAGRRLPRCGSARRSRPSTAPTTPTTANTPKATHSARASRLIGAAETGPLLPGSGRPGSGRPGSGLPNSGPPSSRPECGLGVAVLEGAVSCSMVGISSLIAGPRPPPKLVALQHGRLAKATRTGWPPSPGRWPAPRCAAAAVAGGPAAGGRRRVRWRQRKNSAACSPAAMPSAAAWGEHVQPGRGVNRPAMHAQAMAAQGPGRGACLGQTRRPAARRRLRGRNVRWARAASPAASLPALRTAVKPAARARAAVASPTASKGRP